MIHPKYLTVALGITFSTLVGIATIASLAGQEDAWYSLFTTSLYINIIAFIMMLLIAFFTPTWYLNKKLFEQRAKHDLTQLDLNRTLNALGRAREVANLDVVTGIPNERKWIHDFNQIRRSESSETPFHQVIIDLDNFREINNEFGYEVGDRVIRYFAQSIYDNMRRNEEIYKKDFHEKPKHDDLWKRIYRKYNGGDEFIFIIRGVEAEALGFLVALQRRIDGEINKHISQNIMGRPYAIAFHGAICPLYREDDEVSAKKRLEECLRIATQEGSNYRVFWYSRNTSDDIIKMTSEDNKDRWMVLTYQNAEKLFTKNSISMS